MFAAAETQKFFNILRRATRNDRSIAALVSALCLSCTCTHVTTTFYCHFFATECRVIKPPKEHLVLNTTFSSSCYLSMDARIG